MHNKCAWFLGKVLNMSLWCPKAVVTKRSNLSFVKILWLGSWETNYLLCHIEANQFSCSPNIIQYDLLDNGSLYAVIFVIVS